MKQKLEAIPYNSSTNLYQHLVEVFKLMITARDDKSYDLFEWYSQMAQNANSQTHPWPILEPAEVKEQLEQLKRLIGGPAAPKAGGDEPAGEEAPGPSGFVANLVEEARWFERAGVGFGEEHSYLIMKSITKLAITKSLKQAKFWGKILGSQKDYYVVECAAEGAEEGQLPPDVEPKGTGINKSTYWVTTDLNGTWRELPTITPQHMRVSRRIKRLFTGYLDNAMFTNPHFPGKEAHYLKCQIVRISFSCLILPRTMFNVNAQDKKEIEPAEDWKVPSFQFIASLGNWVHHPQNILLNGRLTLQKPEIPEGVQVDEEKLMKQLEAKDPLERRLKPLSEDKNEQSEGWTLRVHGDCVDRRAATKVKDWVNSGFISLKSIIWKGWVTIYHNRQWTSLYVGYGHKNSSTWYYPAFPDALASERTDTNEPPEPNFPPEPQVSQKEPNAEDPPAE